MSRLAGKVVVVTGTSPNIGGGIAEGLADEGARVVCVDIDADDAGQCAESIKRRGGEALGIVCDVTDEAQVEAMVARAREAYGGVDVLVNNAGILGGLSVLEMPLERWNRQIGVNLTGTFLCTKHVARLMVEQGRRETDRISNTPSVASSRMSLAATEMTSSRYCAWATMPSGGPDE